jgi:hypothetical protein
MVRVCLPGVGTGRQRLSKLSGQFGSGFLQGRTTVPLVLRMARGRSTREGRR